MFCLESPKIVEYVSCKTCNLFLDLVVRLNGFNMTNPAEGSVVESLSRRD